MLAATNDYTLCSGLLVLLFHTLNSKREVSTCCLNTILYYIKNERTA